MTGPLFVAFVLSGVGLPLLLATLAAWRSARNARSWLWQRGWIGGEHPVP